MIRLVLLRILESYFRHRFLYLLPILIMLGIAVASSVYTKPTYISRGAIYVQKDTLLTSLTSISDSGVSWVTPAQSTSDEFKELLLTDAFIRAIIKQTDLEARMGEGEVAVGKLLIDVRAAIWVQTLGNNLLLVGAADENGQIAQQLASAAIEAYIQWKINADRDESASAQAFFSNLVQSYSADLDKARQDQTSYLEAHPDPARGGDRPLLEQVQIKRFEEAVSLATTRLTNAMEKEDSAKLALAQAEGKARQTYLVIDTPIAASKPEVSRKDILVKVAIYAVVGVILCIVGILGGALLDGSFRFPIDVSHALDLPVLAVLPDITPRGRKARRK